MPIQTGLGTPIPATPSLLSTRFAQFSDAMIGIDRSTNRINGYIVAEVGEFKDKRGSFDRDSLSALVALGNADPRGVRSRFGHPNQSDDKLDKHLGRAKNFRLDPDGQRVRADLHLADSAMKEPVGGGRPLGEYVMDRIEEDPGALSSSIVVQSAKKKRRGPSGEELADHWLPTKLQASDVVSEGNAVHGDLLSIDGLDAFLEGSTRKLPTRLAVVATEYLNQMFPDAERKVVEARFNGFRDRYLSNRFRDTGKTVDDQLAKINEMIVSVTTNVVERRREASQQLAAQIRVTEISALCAISGVAKDGEMGRLMADDNLSVGDVRQMLYMRQAMNNQPAGDDAAGESGDLLSADQKKAKAVGKLKAEYDELRFNGEVSFDEFCKFAATRDSA